MNTIDSLLEYLVVNRFVNNENISKNDQDTLKNLHKSMLSQSYITKNQGNLIVRIIKENIDSFLSVPQNMIDVLEDPIFLREFRMLSSIRNISIQELSLHSDDNLPHIVATIAYSVDALKVVQKMAIWRKLDSITNTAMFACELTEKNVVAVVDQLTPFNFVFCDDILQYYETIKSWSEEEIKNQFLLTEIKNQNFQEHITDDLGADTPVDELIINDRRLRYQYFTKNTFPSNSLTEIIANRPTSKIWVNSNNYSLTELFSSLVILKRLPVLLVFGSTNDAELVKNLNYVSQALDSLGLQSNIGIYFRLPNTEIGKPFNDIISMKQYNCVLDSNTQVAGVQPSKLPKFFIKNQWRPLTVISINDTLRHSKVAIYSNCCDLVISYTKSEPIIETRNLWE